MTERRRNTAICATLFLFLVFSVVKGQITFTSENGTLLANNKPFFLKGVNWFGFESELAVAHGLWTHGVDFFVDFIADNNFNAVRMPISVQVAYENPIIGVRTMDPNFQGWFSLDALQYIVRELGKRNVLVMIDFHKATGTSGWWDLWYGPEYSEAQVILAWQVIANRFCGEWNFFAADLKNEPKGAATWAPDPLTGALDFSWAAAAGRIGNAVLSICPRLLIFVEGVAQTEGYWWGQDFNGIDRYPLQALLSNPKKAVLSPHVYGPGVHLQTYFTDPTMSNMPAIWESQMGWLQGVTKLPVIIGEWGGWYDSKPNMDKAWMDTFTAWLLSKNWSCGFYWSLNPNSGDTGGLLTDDWQYPVMSKLRLLSQFKSTSVAGLKAESGSGEATYGPTATYYPSSTPSRTPTPWSGPWPGVRINCGGSAVIDDSGYLWIADAGYFTTSQTAQYSRTIGGGLWSIFKSERYASQMTFTYPLPRPGTYDITLYMSESYFSSAAGRIFSIYVNNELMVLNLDIYGTVGKDFPLVQTFPRVTCNTNKLEILLVALVNNGQLNGIAIFESANETSPLGPVATQVFYTPLPPPTPLPLPIGQFIDSGSNINSIDNLGRVWFGDDPYCLGGTRVFYDGLVVQNTPAAAGYVFQSERYGQAFTCSIPVPEPGFYDVYLYFAELYFTQSAARVFTVQVQGNTVLQDLDIYSEAGKNWLLRKQIQFVNVTNTVNIAFLAKANNAEIVAMVISPSGPTPIPTSTPTNTRRPTFRAAPTRTPSSSPTRGRTPTRGNTPTKLVPTRTGSRTPSRTGTSTRSSSPSRTSSPTRSSTRTPTRTRSPTKGRTPTRSVTRGRTPTRTRTYTRSRTPTRSFTKGATPTRRPFFSRTPSRGPSPTATASPTPLYFSSGPVVGVAVNVMGPVYSVRIAYTVLAQGITAPYWPTLNCDFVSGTWLNIPNDTGYTTLSPSGATGLILVTPLGAVTPFSQAQFSLAVSCVSLTGKCIAPTCRL